MRQPKKKQLKKIQAKKTKSKKNMPKSKRRTAKAQAGSDEAALRAAAQRLDTALRTGNKAAAAKLLAGAFEFIDARGQRHTRAQLLASLKSLAPARAAGKPRLTVYGAIAMRTGARTSARKTEVYFLDVWLKGKDGWRALVRHDNVLAAADAAPAHAPSQPRPRDAQPPECNNPLAFVPYQPKSTAERAIIRSFQTLEQAVTRNDADAWVPHMADEFAVTRTNQHPTSKAERAAFMRRQQTINAETFVAEVAGMKLWVRGKAAVMRADHVMPGNRRPPYRATRVWVQRDGRWQMAVSQQTTMAG